MCVFVSELARRTLNAKMMRSVAAGGLSVTSRNKIKMLIHIWRRVTILHRTNFYRVYTVALFLQGLKGTQTILKKHGLSSQGICWRPRCALTRRTKTAPPPPVHPDVEVDLNRKGKRRRRIWEMWSWYKRWLSVHLGAAVLFTVWERGETSSDSVSKWRPF